MASSDYHGRVTALPRPARKVAVVTLGCARNEVDSEELAGRLAADGYELVDDADTADAVLVNTCGFIETAKKDSVDALLAAADSGAPVVAVGCMAERYGSELAGALPEATVLGFDDYAAIGNRLDDVLAGRPLVPHTPRDRRTLLPISPVDRTTVTGGSDAPAIPGHDWLRRRRLASGPSAALKLASGCDRRCAFCAIPAFRGAFVSRPAAEVLGEARWLASQGVTEIVLVSENSTSYGKDLGDLRSLERLLPQLAAVEGIVRVRVAYLQPAELRPGLLEVIAGAGGGHGGGIAPYFDLSFQHSSPTLLRRMRRFGGTDDFLALIERARTLAPTAGFRTNVILGFPGETEDDVAELERFLTEARLDAVGVFGYSDEEGTEAVRLPGKLDVAEIAARVRRISDLVEELTAQRAEDRLGERVDVLLLEQLGDGEWVGSAAHQDAGSDGTTLVTGAPADAVAGAILPAEVVGTEGVDLVAAAVPPAVAGAGN